MAVEVVDCIQGTPEWIACRLGLVTSSMFKTVLANGKGGGESLTRATYMRKLAGEIITGEPMENYVSADMERGKLMEDEARSYYAFSTGANMQRVGFIRNGAKGCSPDSLIDTQGMFETKSNAPHVLIELILKNDFPPAHKAQCQGGLWVAERDWIDICCYWPKMPALIVRATRDENYIANLAREVDRFNEELHEIVGKIKRYGMEQTQ